MKTEEKIKLVEEIVERKKSLDDFFDKFQEVFGDCVESNMWKHMWEMFEDYVKLAEKMIGDDFESVGWFIWDNDCGKNEYSCFTSKDVEIIVKTPKDLIRFIEYG